MINYSKCAERFVKQHYKIIAMLILAVAVIPFLMLTYYSRPCVDDYSYAVDTHALIKSGNWNLISLFCAAWKTDVRFYHEWQGLYTSAFVLALQPGILGERWYGIGGVALIALMFGLTYYFLKTIFSLLGITKNNALSATVTIVLTLNGMPNIVQGLYWFNGAWNYIPFFYLTLFNVALLLKYEFGMTPRKRWLMGSMLLSFLISGGNHVTGFLNIMLLALGLLLTRKKKILLFPLVSALMGYFIMIIAPGTAVRQSRFYKPSIMETVKAAFTESFKEIFGWLDAQWGIAMLLVLMLAFSIPHICMKPSGKKIWLLLFTSWVIFCGILCVPYYGMGYFGEGRIANINWLTFMFLSAVNVFYIGVFLAQNVIQISEHFKAENGKIALLVCLLLLAFRPGATLHSVIKELNDGTAQIYATACDDRYRQMEAMAQGDTLYTTELPRSENLRFDDVCDNLEDWRNAAWESYYGIKIIAVPSK